MPLNWAGTQNNLGNTLGTLGERESGTARLEEAVPAFRGALAVAQASGAQRYIEMIEANLARASQLLQKAHQAGKANQ